MSPIAPRKGGVLRNQGGLGVFRPRKKAKKSINSGGIGNENTSSCLENRTTAKTGKL